MLKNQLYSELIRLGIPYDTKVLRSQKGRAWVREQLPVARVRCVLDLLEETEETLGSYNHEVLLPKYDADPRAQLLATIPGVGYYTALTVLALVGDIHRFRDSSALVAYAGLAPRVHQSATSLHLGPISRAGPSDLRWVVGEAAQMHLVHCSRKRTCRLCKFYARLSRRRGKQKALVALAAKILRIMYWMLTMNQPYRPQGLNPGLGACGSTAEK
jgi:transposase